MKERCHKQSRLTVPALCQSQSAASAASLNFNKLNLFSKRPCEQLYNKIVKNETLMPQYSCLTTKEGEIKGKSLKHFNFCT